MGNTVREAISLDFSVFTVGVSYPPRRAIPTITRSCRAIIVVALFAPRTRLLWTCFPYRRWENEPRLAQVKTIGKRTLQKQGHDKAPCGVIRCRRPNA